MKRGLWLLLICLCFPILANAKENYYYLALGDSITKGYGIENKNNTYTIQVKQHLESILNQTVQLDNQAINGITSQTLYEHINKPILIEKIKQANLITISIGSNDFLYELTNNIPDYYLGTTNLETFKTISNELHNNMEKIYNKIYDLNPNVILIVLPLYNPYKEILHTKVNKAFEELQNDYIEQINTRNKNSSNPIYVPQTLMTILEKEENLNLDIENSNLDPHPNINGNQAIAKEINHIVDTIYIVKENNKLPIYIYIIPSILLILIIYIVRKNKQKRGEI